MNLILDEVPQDRAAIDAIVERYGEAYEKEFGYRFDSDLATVEFVNARAAAIGVTSDAELQPAASRNGKAEPRRTRPVFFEERNEFADTPIFDRGSLGPGTGIAGPAVIEQDDTTVLVPPGTKVEVDGYLNLLIDARGA
jgi:N-methylhydantoinase A